MNSLKIDRYKMNGFTIVAAPDQVSSELAGEAVILNLETGKYYGLNPIGTRIWDMVQEPRALSEILNTLLAEYDVDKEQCEQDLMLLLEQLSEHKLIKVTNGHGQAA